MVISFIHISVYMSVPKGWSIFCLCLTNLILAVLKVWSLGGSFSIAWVFVTSANPTPPLILELWECGLHSVF